MPTTTLLRTSAIATTIALLLSAGTALANRDGKDDRDRGGDRGGNRAAADRSGGSGRSFSGDSKSSSVRSSDIRPSFRSSDSGRSSDGNRSFRSSDGVRFSDGDRSLRSSDVNRSLPPQTFRSSDSDSRSGRSIDLGRSFQGSNQFRSGQTDPRQYEARRPTSDNVQSFLGLRGNDRDRRDGDRDRNMNFGDRDRNMNFSDRTRDRNFADRDRGDGVSDRWSKTWYGNKGDGHDNRDWSGHWRNSDRFTVADRIRRDWNGRRDNDRFFHGDWWRSRHRGNYWGFWGDYAYRFNRPWYWWSWATGPRLATWIAYDWPSPYYWDYGPGEYIYCDNGAVYVNGRSFEPQPLYYDQTVRLIEQVPVLTAESAARLEWMPLGVFVATPDGVAEPVVTLQLAVTKDGLIGGTAFDPRSDAAFNVVGTVDKRTQRAVWSYMDDRNKRVIMESSIYNLTQPEATGMVHYGPADMQVVELVRLPEPSSGSQPAEASTSTLPPPAVSR